MAGRTMRDETLRWSLVVLSALFVILVATGFYLAFRYEPVSSSISDRVGDARLIRLTRSTHRDAAWLFLATGVVVLAQCIGIAVSRAKRSVIAAGFGFVLVGAAVALYNGPPLAWDQLALSAVSVGDQRGPHGYGFVFGHPAVRAVLFSSTEVALGTFRDRFWLHVLVLPLVLLVVGTAVAVMSGGFGPSRVEAEPAEPNKESEVAATDVEPWEIAELSDD